MQAALFLALLLLLATAILGWIQLRARKRLALLESTQLATVAHLRSLAETMARGSLGPGYFHFLTEVRGRVVCETALRSQLSETPCVHYRSQVSRQYDETYWETDSQGRRRQRTRTGSESLVREEHTVPFLLDDGTGTIRIESNGAEMHPLTTLSRFDPSGDRRSVRIGALDLELPPPVRDRRTTGYRYEERAVPVGHEVFVLGEVSDESGELRIQCPRDEGKFLVSTEGEEEMTRALRRRIELTRYAALGCGVVGLLLLLVVAL